MRKLDIAAMFGSLWLLASMVIDVLTPKELTVYMIGAAIAPFIAFLAVLYWKRVPRFDFAIAFGTLWMTAGIVLELITPKSLSLFAVVIAHCCGSEPCKQLATSPRKSISKNSS